MNSYINLFINSALINESPAEALLLALLFFARIYPIIALSPFFGARILPHPVKAALGIGLFAIFLPFLLVIVKTPPQYNIYSILLFLKEFTVGSLIGFMMSVPFTMVQASGMFIDHQRGGSSLMVNDPNIQNQSSPLGTMFNFVLIYIFFLMNGPFLFIEAILQSYEIVPPDQWINPNFFAPNSPSWEIAVRLLNKTMKVAVQLATPALLAILMTDLFLGIINRLAQQVQITFLGLPLKSLLALTVLCIGWKLFTSQMSREMYSWLYELVDFIQLFNPLQTTDPEKIPFL